MVSQGAQTNGMNGKKLTKSYSEMGSGIDAGCQYEDDKGWVQDAAWVVPFKLATFFIFLSFLFPPNIFTTLSHHATTSPHDHDFLYRTQSEDSPKSPLDMSYIKPSSGYMMTTAEIHSRTSSRQSQLETSRSDTMSTDNFFIDSYHSHDSANSYRSGDANFTKSAYDNSSSMNSQDNLMIPRRASHTLQTEPIFIGRNELEQMRVPRSGQNAHEFESHSLPRRTCIHHNSEEYHTHSLPRREHHHHYVHEHNDVQMSNGNIPEQIMTADGSGKRRLSVSYQDAQHSYVNVVPETYSLSRRSSAHLQPQQVPSLSMNLHAQVHHHAHHPQPPVHQPQPQQQVVPPCEELCSTCSSETESSTEEEDEETGSETECEEDDEEKEIFIDFKPRLSPTPSPPGVAGKKKKRLVKAMSEGEILHEDNGKRKHMPIHSASDEDLAQPPTDYSKKHLDYAGTPIRDEDIFKADNFLNVAPDASTIANRYTREAFRKRSVSLEDPLADVATTKKTNRRLQANGSSPGSPSFASSDDVTREHSEGHWNESQTTVLPQPPRWDKRRPRQPSNELNGIIPLYLIALAHPTSVCIWRRRPDANIYSTSSAVPSTLKPSTWRTWRIRWELT